MEVCHICDNKICCNPDHLFLGTHADNMRDMVAKGRDRKATGECNGSAKLTHKDVADIRALYAAGSITQQALADAYGVGHTAIYKIVNNLTWCGEHSSHQVALNPALSAMEDV